MPFLLLWHPQVVGGTPPVTPPSAETFSGGYEPRRRLRRPVRELVFADFGTLREGLRLRQPEAAKLDPIFRVIGRNRQSAGQRIVRRAHIPLGHGGARCNPRDHVQVGVGDVRPKDKLDITVSDGIIHTQAL